MKKVSFKKELEGKRVVLKEHPIIFEHSIEALDIINRNREIFEKYLAWAEKTNTAEDHFKEFLMSLEGKIG